jgi:hypothetical protein
MVDIVSNVDFEFRFRRGAAWLWTERNPVLAPGEPGVEFGSSPVKYKIGDGVTAWNDLPYMMEETRVSQMIAAAIAALPPSEGGSGVSEAEFQSHVSSESPHTIYDDGTSFLLRYENAKV